MGATGLAGTAIIWQMASLLTADLLEALREKLARGLPVAQAARELRIPLRTAYTWANRHKLGVRSTKISPRVRGKIDRLLRAGNLSLKAISRQCGVSMDSVLSANKRLLGGQRPRHRRLLRSRRCNKGHLVLLWPCIQCTAEGET